MALSVLASKSSAVSVRVDRRGRGPARPNSPKLGNFTRVYTAIPRFKDKLSGLGLDLSLGLDTVPGLDNVPGLDFDISPKKISILPLKDLEPTTTDDSPRRPSPGHKEACCATVTNDDSPARDSTRDSTPASSPATPDDYDFVGKSVLGLGQTPWIVSSEKPFHEQFEQINVAGFQAAQKKYTAGTAYHNGCHPAYQPPVVANLNEPDYLCQLRLAERIAIAELAEQQICLPCAHPFSVTWDMNGNFFPGQEPVVQSSWVQKKYVSKNSIDALYRVNKQTQLTIAKARMQRSYHVDNLLLKTLTPQAFQPIHVFVDLSNIIIGFYDCLKAKRGVSATKRVQAPPFFYEAFATVIERSRPCAKRIVVGSKSPRSAYQGYIFEAEKCGYEMNILQRLPGRKITPAERARAANTLDVSSEDTDDYGPWCPPLRHREQGVDEILHMKMLQSIVDASKPGTMVLATGDAAEAEFSDGFLSNVERALKQGWNVELIGWRKNISAAWRDQAFKDKWGIGRFRVIELDQVAEELLGWYLRPGEVATL